MEAILKVFILGLLTFSSLTVFGNTDFPDLKDLKVVLYSDLTPKDAKYFCKKKSKIDPEICLMTRKKAVKYCKAMRLRLPSARDFAKMAAGYGAYVGKKACGSSSTCQRIRPSNDEEFYYNSGGADVRGLLREYWFHTSSLREKGANFHFHSHNGYMGSSSDKNPGIVACI